MEYAWYIFKDNEKKDTIWYSKEDYIVYKFYDRGNYEFHVYIKDNNETKKVIKLTQKIII